MANRNDPRVVRTRRLIQDAFLKLIQTRDFKDITIADITEQATVNRATFYAHFQDKYELLEAVVTKQIQMHLVKQLDGKKGLGHENLRLLIVAVCDYHDALSRRCREVHQLFAPLVEEQIRKLVLILLGDKAENEMNGIIADMLSCAIYGAVNHRYLSTGLADRDTLISEMLPFLHAGLAATGNLA